MQPASFTNQSSFDSCISSHFTRHRLASPTVVMPTTEPPALAAARRGWRAFGWIGFSLIVGAAALHLL